MAYATTTELATFTGIAEADLPSDADRLLKRATELIDYYTFNRIDTTVTTQQTAAQKATCAQVEWWIENNDEQGLKSMIESYSSGGYNVSFSKNGLPKLAPRVKHFLNPLGLLFSGVELK